MFKYQQPLRLQQDKIVYIMTAGVSPEILTIFASLLHAHCNPIDHPENHIINFFRKGKKRKENHILLREKSLKSPWSMAPSSISPLFFGAPALWNACGLGGLGAGARARGVGGAGDLLGGGLGSGSGDWGTTEAPHEDLTVIGTMLTSLSLTNFQRGYSIRPASKKGCQ